MSESSSIKSHEIISQAIRSLGKEFPPNDSECLYGSGLLDSAEIMQLILEIELETDKRMDLAKLMEGEISIIRLIKFIEEN